MINTIIIIKNYNFGGFYWKTQHLENYRQISQDLK